MAITDLENLKKVLAETWARVEFTKMDGTNRSMLCTRNFVDVPDEQKPHGDNRKVNESVISVFDLEKQGWRSIKIENINSWRIERNQ